MLKNYFKVANGDEVFSTGPCHLEAAVACCFVSGSQCCDGGAACC